MYQVDVQFEDVPDEVLDEVMRQLQHYLVTFVAFSPNRPDDPMQLVGSGTLVQIGEDYGILTASHVWNVLQEAARVFIPFGEKPGGFSMAIAGLHAREIRDRQDAEWGPDLALLRIPEASLGTIKAAKSFLNLTRHRAELESHPPQIDKGFWAVLGMVGELSTVQANLEARVANALVQSRAFFGGIDHYQERGDWDYLDVGADMTLDDTPISFGGLSGGALWQVDLEGDGRGKPKWTGRAHFRGVIFWQTQVTEKRRAIRCHGPKSVFNTMWAAWQFPTPMTQ